MNRFLSILIAAMAICYHTSNGRPIMAEKDSLSQILRSLKPRGKSYTDDTIRIRIMTQLSARMTGLGESKDLLQNALVFSKQIGWEQGEYLAEYSLGRAYNKHGAYVKALERLFMALFLAEKKKNMYLQADCLQRIGDSYLMLKQYPKAIDNYKRSIAIFKSLGKTIDYIDCLNNLALVYYAQKQYDHALKLLRECMSNRPAVRGTIHEASFLSNISSCYRNKGQLDSALYYFNQTLDVYRAIGSKYKDLLAITLVEKARVHDLLGDYRKAIQLANEAYSMNGKYYGNNLYVTEFLSEMYAKNHDYKNAYSFGKKYFQAWEDAQKQDRDKQVASLKFEYENKQSKAAIELLNKDIARKATERKILSGGLIVLFLGLMGSIWSFRVLMSKNAKIEMQRKELTQVSKELELSNATLEQQVEFRTSELREANDELVRKNREVEEALYRGQHIERKRVASELHDNLGSTISGLIWQLDGLVMENKAPQLHGTYHDLIDRMREAYSEIRHISHNLYPAELEKYGLSESIDRLITNLNRNNRIVFSFRCEGLLTGISKQIQLELYATAMELLNNVTKHSEATEAVVELKATATEITLVVSDNGIGFRENFSFNNGGKGFMNITERLNTIDGSLEIVSSAEGRTSVQIAIRR